MHHPALPLALAAGLITALALPLPASAHPAPPVVPARAYPAGEALYGLSCEWAVIPDMLHLFSLDADSGAGERIGSTPRSGPTYFCSVGVAWDRVASSCRAYTAALDPDLDAALVRIDLLTGASTVVAPMTVSGPEVSASGLAIDSSGVAWVVSEGVLHTIDLATAILTPVASVAVRGLAWNAQSGQLLGFSNSAIYSIDRGTGALTLVADLSAVTAGTFIEALDVDREGTFWLGIREPSTTALDVSEWVTNLWSVEGGVAELEGPVIPGGTKLFTQSLLSVSADACALPTLALPDPTVPVVPTLAATGLEDATPILLPIAALALALGALLVSSARPARPAGGRRRESRRGPR